MSMNEVEEGLVNDDSSDLLKISELNVEAQTIMMSLYNLRVNIKNIENDMRHYEKEVVKFIRHLRKNQRVRGVRKVGGDGEKKEREPSGFAKKTKVRKELMDFFKRPEVMEIINTIVGEEEAKEESKFEPMDEEGMINRPSATKIINRYIRDMGLQKKKKQYFTQDDALKKILLPLEQIDKKPDKDGFSGYRCFNLQKYIKHLFI